MQFSWNIINNTGEPYDLVAQKVRPKILKLENLLVHFPPEAVHLQIVVGHNARKKTYNVGFNLRLPSNILHADKDSPSLLRALDSSATALVRQLKKAKADYRHDFQRRRRQHRQEEVRSLGEFTPRPLPEGVGPRQLAELIAEVLKENYEGLLSFVERRMNEFRFSGLLPKGAIDPRDVVDQVAQTVLRHPGLRPRLMPYDRWCFSLAAIESRKAVRKYLQTQNEQVPLDLEVPPKGSFALAEEHDDEDPYQAVVESTVEPEHPTMRDHVPDPATEPPYRPSQSNDLLDSMRTVVRKWPRIDREIFEMHYHEGLEAPDIAMVYSCEEEFVDHVLARTQQRLRRWMMTQTGMSDDFEVTDHHRQEFASRLTEIAGKEG